MECPYCKNEMVKGVIEGDGRAPFRWINEGEKIGLIDRVFGGGEIAKSHPFSHTTIEGYNCKSCKKVIIDLK